MFKKQPQRPGIMDLLGRDRPKDMDAYRRRIKRVKSQLPEGDLMQDFLDLALVCAELGYEYRELEG